MDQLTKVFTYESAEVRTVMVEGSRGLLRRMSARFLRWAIQAKPLRG